MRTLRPTDLPQRALLAINRRAALQIGGLIQQLNPKIFACALRHDTRTLSRDGACRASLPSSGSLVRWTVRSASLGVSGQGDRSEPGISCCRTTARRYAASSRANPALVSPRTICSRPGSTIPSPTQLAGLAPASPDLCLNNGIKGVARYSANAAGRINRIIRSTVLRSNGSTKCPGF